MEIIAPVVAEAEAEFFSPHQAKWKLSRGLSLRSVDGVVCYPHLPMMHMDGRAPLLAQQGELMMWTLRSWRVVLASTWSATWTWSGRRSAWLMWRLVVFEQVLVRMMCSDLLMMFFFGDLVQRFSEWQAWCWALSLLSFFPSYFGFGYLAFSSCLLCLLDGFGVWVAIEWVLAVFCVSAGEFWFL